ncbi:MAG: FlgD immunoglobulin-like domain containing protein, partial [Candidatus Eisenbacteria bacterium]|nr:FlgD immunoglobulin-like domain containing protein [Candidatus Eisenbacteria bacterium]
GTRRQRQMCIRDRYYTILITQSVLFDDAEIDGGWSLSAPGDDAVSGLWVRDDPVGTVYNGAPVQPENDHTPAPGHICFVTGNANPGDNPTTNDVDNGCTTLTSPAFDLSGAERGFVTYWRWFGQYVSVDDNFQIDGSSDGGATWVPLEQIPGNAASWQRSSVELSAALDLTNNMKVRFRACDQGAGGLVEAAVDDFTIESFQPNVAGAEEGGLSMRPALAQNEPNPFNPVTKIQFTLSNGGDARLEVYDAAGRLIRVLQDGPMMAGTHTVLWNGLDDQGRAVGSGVYFYRLKAGAFEQSRRMTILK